MSAAVEDKKEHKGYLIAIDPGINFCSLVTIDTENEFKVINSVLVKNARAFTPEEKIKEASFGPRAVKVGAIIKKLEELIEQYGVTTIVVEAPFYNALTPMAYGSLLEVIFAIKYAVVIPRGLKFELIEPTLVKKLFANKGYAAKEAMRQFLHAKKASGEIILPYEVDSLSEHEVDGVAIGFVYNLGTKTEKS